MSSLMKRRRRRPELNLVALIDVLVMLIFFAFVTMQTVDDAKRAVEELHDKEFMGRKLVVSGAKTTDMNQQESENAA